MVTTTATKWIAPTLIAGALLAALRAESQTPAQFVIDIDRETIGSIGRRDSYQQLQARFGARNVRRATEQLEGEAQEMIVVKISGHEVIRHWNHVSTQDRVFKTREGLGVGSLLAAFSRYYGAPSPGEGEGGPYVSFKSPSGAEFQVVVAKECLAQLPSVGPTCAVKKLLL